MSSNTSISSAHSFSDTHTDMTSATTPISENAPIMETKQNVAIGVKTAPPPPPANCKTPQGQYIAEESALEDLPGITHALDLFLASHMVEAESYCHQMDPTKSVIISEHVKCAVR